MKTVFILGAGASSEIGIPAVNEFLPKLFHDIKNYYSKDALPGNQDYSKNERVPLLDRMEQIGEYKKLIDSCNVEELFSFSDFMATVNSSEQIHHSIKKNLKEMILKTILVSVLQSNPDRTVYKEFANLVRSQNCPVITFNWDLFLDEASGRLDYGTDKIKPATSDPCHIVPNGRGESYRLFKLHGSINWCEGSGGVLEATRNPVDFNKHLEGKQGREPAIVPPTYAKFIVGSTDLEIQLNAALNQIWNGALMELISADVIFIVGFSFPETDNHFRLFMKYAMKKNLESGKLPKIAVITRPKRLLQDRLEFERKYDDILSKGMGLKPEFYYMKFSTFVQILVSDMPALQDEGKFKKMMHFLLQSST